MSAQREYVRYFALEGRVASAQRETHRDACNVRRPRVPAAVTTEQVTESIRDLGVLLAAAETDRELEWLSMRLRNRLDVLDAISDPGGQLRAS